VKGFPTNSLAKERACRLRAEGWALQEIADELGLSDSWVSKETKGIAPGQRSRFRHLNKIDVPGVIKGFRERGLTDAQIARELKISVSYAHFLRRRHVGLSAASTADRDLILDLLRQGRRSSSVAEEFELSTSFVNDLRVAAGIPAAQTVRTGARRCRPMADLLGYIRSHFTYDAETGAFCRRGKAVGCLRNGYVSIAVKSRGLMAHRLAWLMHYGEEPPAVIDHIDGDPANNRISNLRAATPAQNAFNKRRASNNSTGVKGVSLGSNGRYRVRVQAGSKSADYEARSLNEAREARQRLANLLHGEFARHA